MLVGENRERVDVALSDTLVVALVEAVTLNEPLEDRDAVAVAVAIAVAVDERVFVVDGVCVDVGDGVLESEIAGVCVGVGVSDDDGCESAPTARSTTMTSKRVSSVATRTPPDPRAAPVESQTQRTRLHRPITLH